MLILIHTYGRADRQITWKNLSPSVRERTLLVIQKREEHLYKDYPTVVLPDDIHNLTDTRQYLMTSCVSEDGKICIMDDDLQFAVRRDDDRSKFRQPEPMDIDYMFQLLMEWCSEDVPLVGVGAREGGNFNTKEVLHATRQMRLHCIHTPTYNKLGVRFDRVPVMEDFDVTLQFLEKGYENAVLNHWVTNQSGSNTTGGCSAYRTLEVQAESANRLAVLHPGIVQVVKKQTKTSWGGQERTDVKISWKRAAEQGRAYLLGQNAGDRPAVEGERSTEAVD